MENPSLSLLNMLCEENVVLYSLYLNLFPRTSVPFANACLPQLFSLKQMRPSVHVCGCFSFPFRVSLSWFI